MKINNEQASQNADALKKLLQSQKREIKIREKELSNIKDIYDQKVKARHHHGEKVVIEAHHLNEKRLEEATEGKEQKLQQLKTNLQNTKDRLDKESAILKKEHSKKIENIKKNHALKTQEVFDDNSKQLRTFNNRTNNIATNVKMDSNRQIEKIRHKTAMSVDQAAFESDQKIAKAQSGQSNQIKRAQDRFSREYRILEDAHKDKIVEQTSKNNIQINQQEQIYNDKKNKLNTHYHELLRGTKESFEHKYETMITKHQEVLSRLEDRFKSEKDSKTKELTNEHKVHQVREGDSFYQLKTIAPKVSEDDSSYHISIDTPEFEKDNYNLTANKRRIKISFNRRSEKRLDAPGSSVQSSRNSQSMIKEFRVSEIVDDRNVKVTYNDGTLTFRLPKA